MRQTRGWRRFTHPGRDLTLVTATCIAAVVLVVLASFVIPWTSTRIAASQPVVYARQLFFGEAPQRPVADYGAGPATMISIPVESQPRPPAP